MFSLPRLLAVSMAMLVVPFLPATNLLFRVGFVIAERVLYLSSAGGVMLIVLGASALSARYRTVRCRKTYLNTCILGSVANICWCKINGFQVAILFGIVLSLNTSVILR